MNSFGQDFAQGMALGASMFNNSQKLREDDQEQKWKQEDRDRFDQYRSKIHEMHNVMSALDHGDFSPAIALANSSGMLGQGQYAAGAKVDDRGHVMANVYNSNDPTNLRTVDLGTITSVRNQLVMKHAPPELTAQIYMQQAQKSMDPMQQAQVRTALAGAQSAEANARYADQTAQNNLAQGRAQIEHTNTSTAALGQEIQQKEGLYPFKLQQAKGEGALAGWKGEHPEASIKRPVLGRVISDPAGQDGPTVYANIYDPNDPRLKYGALQGPPPDFGKTTPSAIDLPGVDFKANNIKTKGQLLDYLVSSGKAKNRAEAAAMLSSGAANQ